MNTAYRSQSAICRLDHLVDAEWLESSSQGGSPTGGGRSPQAVLRLLFAAPGFGQLRTVDVVEPYASSIWRRISPPDDTPAEPQPPPEPARSRQEPTSPHPHPSPAVGGRDQRNGRENPYGPPAGSPAAAERSRQGSYSPGYRSGNGGSALPTKFPPRTSDAPPRSGRQLFPWLKKQGERAERDLVGYLQEWGHHQQFPARFVDWDVRQTADGAAEVLAYLKDEGVNP